MSLIDQLRERLFSFFQKNKLKNISIFIVIVLLSWLILSMVFTFGLNAILGNEYAFFDFFKTEDKIFKPIGMSLVALLYFIILYNLLLGKPSTSKNELGSAKLGTASSLAG